VSSDADSRLTYACAPPPGVARVDVVVTGGPSAAGGPWLLSRVPEGYRAIVVDDVAEGLAASTAPVVALLDAGADVDPAELPRVAEPVVRGSVDLVLGRPRPAAPAPWHRRVAAAVLGREHPTPDPTPVRAARREGLSALGLAGTDLVQQLAAAAENAGWRVAEVPVRSASEARAASPKP